MHKIAYGSVLNAHLSNIGSIDNSIAGYFILNELELKNLGLRSQLNPLKHNMV